MNVFILIFITLCLFAFLAFVIFSEHKKTVAYRKREEMKIALLTDLCVELKYANGNLPTEDYKVYKSLKMG